MGMSKRRRWALGCLAVFLLVAAFPVYSVLRITVFAPHYDVVSIRTAPEYQDAQLIERAWQLPVAASYRSSLVYQSNGSVCGPSTLANVMRSRGRTNSSESAILDGSGKCQLGFCFMGLTLDELAAVARRTGRRVTVLRDLDLARFRAELAHANDPDRRYTINFHRGPLFGSGGGHHSPIGGYLADRDLVFVLDVNESYHPWLVSTERLFGAMDTVDEQSGLKRGMLLIQ